jgi:AsmA protein
MKKALIVAAAIVAVLVVTAIAVPLVVPTGTWKAEIERRASDATGRKLTIAGPVHLSILPTVAVVANDVTFANAPGAQEPTMASLGKLEVRVRILPLLSGKFAIDRFVVEKPVIHLEIDREGHPNWDFMQAKAASSGSAAQPTAQQSGAGAPSAIELGDVRLDNGTVTYSDARTGAHYEVGDINASLTLANLDSPFKANGSFTWNKEKVALTGEVTQPSALMAGRSSNVGFTVDSKPARFVFSGKAAGTTPARLDGAVDLTVPNVRALAAWLGQKLDAPGSGLGPLAIRGTLAAAGPRVSFTKATYTLDAIEASGDVAVDSSGRVPYVKATLATNMLDLNPYLPQAKAGANGASPAGAGAPSTTPAARASQGWSTEPIDLSSLKAWNADLSLTVAGFRYRAINFGKSVFNVALKDGRLTTDMPELALYGGNGKGRLTVDGSGRVPAVGLTTALSNVDAQPLLKDAMALEAIRGKTNADVTLNATGGSQRDLISALNGKGQVKLEHGAIEGLDLGGMIRNIGSAFDSGSKGGQETGFSEANATFTVANGILKNDDLAMLAPLFRVIGKGTVDLPKRTVDYRIEPKVVADAQGQGGSKDTLGLGVPIVVSGPWDKLSYRPDLAALVPDAQGAARGLRDLLRGGENGGQQPPSGSPSGGSPPQPSQNPLDRLKGLLGR